MPIARRAYSEADKLRREELIVVAAQELLAAKGYFGFSMNDVVAATGLAKGTLYLYFTTKEELCLTVYEREALAWLGELAPVLAELPTPAAPEQIARVLASSAAQRPLLARLTALAPLHFEANVSSERARKHKLLLLRALRPAGRLIEQRAGLRPDDGRVLLVRMQVIMAGLEGISRPPPVMREVYNREPELVPVSFAAELYALTLAVLRAMVGGV